jgi:hypothetical protein
MRTFATLLAYAAVLAFGTYLTFGPVINSGFTRVQTERGDGMLNHYILEHSWQAVSNPDYRGSLFSPPCFYPERATLWYSEHLLGVAPVYWALRVVLPYDLAYQWWQIILDALNFVAFAAVMRWLRCPHIVALLGGYLWAFGLVHIDQIKHQQMIGRFWFPLAAYYAWSFALEPATRSLARMLACVFLQGISCVNTGWFLTAGVFTFLPLAVVLRPGGCRDTIRFLKEHWARTTLIVFVWLAATAAAFVPYIVVNWGQTREYGHCTGLMPTPSAWLTGPPGTRWEKTTAPYRKEVTGECWLFCGFGLYALMLVACASMIVIRRPDHPPEYGVIAAGLITSVAWVALTLTLSHGGHSLWEFVRVIPGAKAIRCVSRVYTIIYLFGTLASLVWLSRVTESLRPRVRTGLLGLIAVVIVFEQTGYDPPSFAKEDFYPIVERTAEQLRGADAGYVVPVYTDTRGETMVSVYGETLGMWAGLRANVPVVNGYSGRWPPGPHPHDLIANDEQLRVWMTGRFRGKLAYVTPDQPHTTRVISIE